MWKYSLSRVTREGTVRQPHSMREEKPAVLGVLTRLILPVIKDGQERPVTKKAFLLCSVLALARHVQKPPTLPGHAVDSLWRDCARWILGLFTIWPTGSCSFFPAKASWENAVWYPGVSSMSMKCSSSGIVSSSGSSKRPMRACSKGVLYVKRGG